MEPRHILPVVVLATASVMPIMLVGSLAVQMRSSLHFGAARLGMAVAGYNFAAAATSVPFGHLTQRLGARKLLASISVAGVLLSVSMAVAVQSWVSLIAAMACAGVVSAATQPAANLYLARHIPPGRLGTAFGIKQASVPLAGTLGGLSVPLVGLTVGWRWAFLAASGLSVAGGALLWRAGSGESTVARVEHHGPGQNHGSREALGPLAVLAVAFGLGIAAAAALAAFVVTSGVDSGIGKATAGLAAAGASAVGLVSRLASGVAADRRGGGHLRSVAAMLAFGAVGYVALAMSGDSVWIFLGGAALAYGAGWGWNGVFNFAIVRSHPLLPARATGITQAGGRTGGIVGPLAFGLIVQNGSFALAWSITAVAALAASALMILGRKMLIANRQALP